MIDRLVMTVDDVLRPLCHWCPSSFGGTRYFKIVPIFSILLKNWSVGENVKFIITIKGML